MASRSREYYESIELNIMQKHSSLPPGSFTARDVKIDPIEHIHCMEINICPETIKPKLLMIHGYGGNNLLFFKMYPFLAPRFHIFSIDLPGMGFNYRDEVNPPFSNRTECIEFFVERINRFVEAVRWERFNLVGHSLGAYFSSHFFDKYTSKVERLFLLSPAAFNGIPTQDTIGTPEAKVARISALPVWKRQIVVWITRLIAKEKKSPFELIGGMLRNAMIGYTLNNKRMCLSSQEATLFTTLYRYLLGLPQYGERCVCFVLEFGLRSSAPIIDVLCRHADRIQDVSVFYGEHDTMDFGLSVQNSFEAGLALEFYQLPDCDHQLILQTPEKLVMLMLEIFDGGSDVKTKYTMKPN